MVQKPVEVVPSQELSLPLPQLLKLHPLHYPHFLQELVLHKNRNPHLQPNPLQPVHLRNLVENQYYQVGTRIQYHMTYMSRLHTSYEIKRDFATGNFISCY